MDSNVVFGWSVPIVAAVTVHRRDTLVMDL